jgi:hypothetical protein
VQAAAVFAAAWLLLGVLQALCQRSGLQPWRNEAHPKPPGWGNGWVGENTQRVGQMAHYSPHVNPEHQVSGLMWRNEGDF